MQLNFQNKFPWETPTHFVEKIWAGFAQDEYLTNNFERNLDSFGYKEKLPREWWNTFMKAKPKLHSIREDKANRWCAGRPIHFVLWRGRPYHSKTYQFCPIVPCVSIQKFEIKEMTMVSSDFAFKHDNGRVFCVLVDERRLNKQNVEKIALNDGFDSLEDFFRWFSEPLRGRIIHWTHLKY